MSSRPAGPYGLAAAILHPLSSFWQYSHSLSKMLWQYLTLFLFIGYGSTHPTEQKPIIADPKTKSTPSGPVIVKDRALQGRFLHITGTMWFEPYHRQLANVCQISILTNTTSTTHRPRKPQPVIGVMAQLVSSALKPQTATPPYPSSTLRSNGSTTTSKTRSISSYGLETPSAMIVMS